MYRFYIDIIALCAVVLMLKLFFRKQLVLYTPLSVFCAMSLFSALMMLDLISWGMAGNAPQYGGNFNNILDFSELGEVLFFSTLAGVIGGLLADLCFGKSIMSNKMVDLHNQYQSDFEVILQRFSFILIVNAIFGIARTLIAFRYLDWSSLGDYRIIVCFELFTKISPLEALIFRISNHLYVLAGFYICIFGAHTAIVGKISSSKLIRNFLLFSVPTMAMGGRLFILNFLVYFFSGFFFLFSTLPKAKGTNAFFRQFTVFISIMLALVCIIGAWRNTGDLDALTEENRPWHGLAYITDSNVILARCLETDIGGSAPLFESTLGDAATFKEIRESWEDLSGYVNGLYSHLLLDFGIPGMYFMWGFFCFLMEAITLGMLSKLNVFYLLLCCVFAKIMEEMLLFPSISGNYYCFQWIFVIYILYLFFYRKDNTTSDSSPICGNVKS